MNTIFYMSRLPRIEETRRVVARARDYLQCKGIVQHLLQLPTHLGENEIITTIQQLEGHEHIKNELISWFQTYTSYQTSINEFNSQDCTQDLLILLDFYDDKFQAELRYLEQLIHGQETFSDHET